MIVCLQNSKIVFTVLIFTFIEAVLINITHLQQKVKSCFLIILENQRKSVYSFDKLIDHVSMFSLVSKSKITSIICSHCSKVGHINCAYRNLNHLEKENFYKDKISMLKERLAEEKIERKRAK